MKLLVLLLHQGFAHKQNLLQNDAYTDHMGKKCFSIISHKTIKRTESYIVFFIIPFVFFANKLFYINCYVFFIPFSKYPIVKSGYIF